MTASNFSKVLHKHRNSANFSLMNFPSFWDGKQKFGCNFSIEPKVLCEGESS